MNKTIPEIVDSEFDNMMLSRRIIDNCKTPSMMEAIQSGGLLNEQDKRSFEDMMRTLSYRCKMNNMANIYSQLAEGIRMFLTQEPMSWYAEPFKVEDIPYEDLEMIDKDFFVKGGIVGYVNGILEPYFSDLNKTKVEVLKDKVVQKRLVLTDEKGDTVYRKNADGTDMYKEIRVSSGFVAVYSSVNIHLPNRIVKNGIKKDYYPTDGYKYVDYIDTDFGRKYMYIIPMEAVYTINLCGLYLHLDNNITNNSFFDTCARNLRNGKYYAAWRIAFKNGYYVYLYTQMVNYRGLGYQLERDDVESGESDYVFDNIKKYDFELLLGAKEDTEFESVVNNLYKYWKREGYLFDTNMTTMKDAFLKKAGGGGRFVEVRDLGFIKLDCPVENPKAEPFSQKREALKLLDESTAETEE